MRQGRRGDIVNVLLVLMALVGLGLMLYPTVSDLWNRDRQTRSIVSYVEATGELSEEQIEEMLGKATAYNRHLRKTDIQWELTDEQVAEYDALLNVDETNVMGCISIPKIDLTLPIYRGTEEEAMQVAATHLAGTSLPIGGKGTHTCITGHRGLPSALLFTNLDKLKEGDTWTITVLDRTVTYEVDQIRIVEPTDLDTLFIDPQSDLCTLITCTPYGVNTHRLLVRGHRIKNAPEEAVVYAEAVRVDARYVALAIAVPVLLVMFLVAVLRPVSSRHSEKTKR